MFGLFKKETEKQRLQRQYEKLLKEAYQLSHTNRKASDQKTAEAEALAQRIAELS